MVTSAEKSGPLSKAEPTKDRSHRIEIWQREVITSPNACACSSPTTQAPNTGLGTLYRRSMSRFDTNLPHYDLEDYPTNPWTIKNARDSFHGQRPSPHCPVCALPLCGVKYKLLSKDGFGLVRPRSPSPKRWSRDEGQSQDRQRKEKSKSVLSKIVRVIQRPKARKPAELGETAKRTQTDMYHDLRPEAVPTRGGVHEEETSSALSDDECKKPKVGISASAARLRRAQMLLQRGGRGD
ncbi:hypothetical protein NPX13_g6627 [Xylaria arbuscula]|uniref:Uncharacterized protein n=1 Tax=Xylaria arbuscula TaxID=114810 RepID=A0A9W8NBV4_9PEZI|nr:hypothetical protein NPX13_g6627 [Xylaria arbuscula]